ncbi:hypothetical protein C8T65DRAFT_702611 [Cerioporus squamosus]|nr:hypothetical protein C8T65DRAFT_702611 [Cerioporus squamosus]
MLREVHVHWYLGVNTSTKASAKSVALSWDKRSIYQSSESNFAKRPLSPRPPPFAPVSKPRSTRTNLLKHVREQLDDRGYQWFITTNCQSHPSCNSEQALELNCAGWFTGASGAVVQTPTFHFWQTCKTEIDPGSYSYKSRRYSDKRQAASVVWTARLPTTSGLTGPLNQTYLGGLEDTVDYITGKGGYAAIDRDFHLHAQLHDLLRRDYYGYNHISNDHVISDLQNEPHDIPAQTVFNLTHAEAWSHLDKRETSRCGRVKQGARSTTLDILAL